MNGPQQFFAVKRLVKKVNGAFFQCAVSNLIINVSRNQYDWQPGIRYPDPPLQFETVHSRHSNVGNQTCSLSKGARLKQSFR